MYFLFVLRSLNSKTVCSLRFADESFVETRVLSYDALVVRVPLVNDAFATGVLGLSYGEDVTIYSHYWTRRFWFRVPLRKLSWGSRHAEERECPEGKFQFKPALSTLRWFPRIVLRVLAELGSASSSRFRRRGQYYSSPLRRLPIPVARGWVQGRSENTSTGKALL